MNKRESILLAIMMTVLIFLGLEDDGYVHKAALFVAGWMAGYLALTAWMEWRGVDE
jgi:hypothetical protein